MFPKILKKVSKCIFQIRIGCSYELNKIIIMKTFLKMYNKRTEKKNLVKTCYYEQAKGKYFHLKFQGRVKSPLFMAIPVMEFQVR